MFAQATPPGSRLGADQRNVGGGAVELGHAGSRRPQTRGRDQQEHGHLAVGERQGAGRSEHGDARADAAPSVTSKIGITIGGQGFGAQTSTGALAGTPQTTTLKPSKGRYALHVARRERGTAADRAVESKPP